MRILMACAILLALIQPACAQWPQTDLTRGVRNALPIANGGTNATSAGAARTTLGLAIGTDIQAYSSILAAIVAGTWTGAASITTLGTIGTGTWQGTVVGVSYGGTGASSQGGARTALGLVIGTDVQAYSATLAALAAGTYTGASSITTLGTVGTGTWQGTAVGVTYGGTGASSASGARTALGVAIGSDVQAYNSSLAAIAAGTWTGASSITTVGTIASGTWQGTAVGILYGGTGASSASSARTALGVAIGSDVQAYDADLGALAGNSTDGFWAHTGAGTGSARTITGTSNQIAVTNGDGVSGNPTIAFAPSPTMPNGTTATTQSAGDGSTRLATTAYADTAATTVGAPTGTIWMYAGSSVPTGWAFCDGSSQLRSGTYAALFAVIGTDYGSADGTHFNLPDLKGRAPVGVGASSATRGTTWTRATKPTSGTGGEQTHILLAAESGLREHAHNPASGQGNYAHATGAAGSGIWSGGSGGSDIGLTGGVNGGTLDGAAHNIMPPLLVVNFIIKL